ncbi:hypothetical protein HDF26_002101 [Pedobacter cryoconitis]|uniref:Uncharacterized protein n=1 Tax=Pedobacter cryoconitis TaxID=188932 RepID=A0A7W8ZJZ2_9SPHI|nr:hypothetical protein [Pedobacter cryoconitis]MBB5635173.1 hypothetical protein [Pedobacter cryoconitis]MBB6271644.1 hypothetical protein [Pedobacter cryoconitis]
MKADLLPSWNYIKSFLFLFAVFSCFTLKADAQYQPQKKQTAVSSVAGQQQILEKGKTGERYFGDLMVSYTVDSTGTNVLCSLYLVTQFVYMRNLNATSPDCDFDVELGLGKSAGRLHLNLINTDPHSVSTLYGNFTYTVSSNNTSYLFKGDLTGWFLSNTIK